MGQGTQWMHSREYENLTYLNKTKDLCLFFAYCKYSQSCAESKWEIERVRVRQNLVYYSFTHHCISMVLLTHRFIWCAPKCVYSTHISRACNNSINVNKHHYYVTKSEKFSNYFEISVMQTAYEWNSVSMFQSSFHIYVCV